MKRALTVLAVIGVVFAALAPPASAGGAAYSSGSAFGKHVDPWRSWGVPTHAPRYYPHYAHPGHPRYVVPRGATVHGHPVYRYHRPHVEHIWVPPAWYWNGIGWVLVPGYWTW